MRGILLDPQTGRPEDGSQQRLTAERRLGLIEELAALEQQDWKWRTAQLLREGVPMAADGLYYHDTIGPGSFISAAQTAITLATTDKLLYPGFLTSLPANFFSRPGKKLRLTVYGTITTALTPGNIGVELYFGTADATGTLLASSAALALVASQTTVPFRIEAYCQCRGVGASGSGGSLFAYAIAKFGIAVVANPNDHFHVPASAPAAVNVDTTVAAGFNVQFKRSGSTAETATTHDVILESLN